MLVRKSDLTDAYYKPGDVAKMLGVVPNTIIAYDRKGLINFERTGTDRRIISKENLMIYLEENNLLINDEEKIRKDVIYARVSTSKQKESGDLERQINNIKIAIVDKAPMNIIVLSEVGSGLNDNRRELKKLIRMILNGEVNRIFISYKDRLTRFGFNYLKEIATFNNVEIIIISEEVKEKSIQEELAEDLISIIHSFSGKLYGMRKKALTKVEEEVSILKGK